MTEKQIKTILYVISLSFIVLMQHGCAACKPEIITKIEYREKLIPVRCNVKIPEKPKFKDTDLSGDKALAKYYATVERLLKGCVYGVAK
ncbi:hypothetical protein [Campylobacter curvus]|jgi:hypothetical protein|uniref:hypothetical protein n=1 Tax=Campylobacter curvus TaxID=200 RepID=UPI001470028D|nr:hypothetical protein [Campylobacter curvus]